MQVSPDQNASWMTPSFLPDTSCYSETSSVGPPVSGMRLEPDFLHSLKASEFPLHFTRKLSKVCHLGVSLAALHMQAQGLRMPVGLMGAPGLLEELPLGHPGSQTGLRLAGSVLLLVRLWVGRHAVWVHRHQAVAVGLPEACREIC